MQEERKEYGTKTASQSGAGPAKTAAKKSWREMRVVPSLPGIFRFLQDIMKETHFVQLIVVLVVLWLVFSAGIYVAESPHNSQFYSYGYTLWWSFTAMQTQGANSPGPITQLGVLLASIWSVIGTVIFFGAIISTVYSYYMIPWRRQHSQPIVDAIQYNLNEIEYLSVEELTILRETIDNVLDARVSRLKKRGEEGET